MASLNHQVRVDKIDIKLITFYLILSSVTSWTTGETTVNPTVVPPVVHDVSFIQKVHFLF